LISQVGVDYPLLAKLARIEGYVLLEIVISREGDVSDLNVVSGPQLLVEPALTAVRQWKYKPTLFKGRPVEVITQVSVPFKL
jgi:protein TonB